MVGNKELITPKLAREYLALNKNIRTISPAWVRYFSLILQRGEFQLTPDGVCFNVDGRLVNGQHRLQAIADTGISAEMMVYHNVTEPQLRAQDLGRKRTVADHLAEDRRVVDVLSAGVRLGTGLSVHPLSYVDTLMQDEPGFAAQYLVRHCGTTAKYFSSANWKLGAVVQMVSGADWRQVADLYRHLVTMDLEELPPVGMAIVRQVFSGMASAADRTDTLARSLVVFDPAKASNTKVQVGDAQKASARETVRAVIGAYLPREEVVQ